MLTERLGKRGGPTPPTPAKATVTESLGGVLIAHPLTEASVSFTGSASTDGNVLLCETTAATWNDGDHVVISSVTPSGTIDAGNYFVVDSTGGVAFSLAPELGGDPHPTSSTMAGTVARYLPADVTHLNVYASSSTGTAVSQALKVGEIAVNRAWCVNAETSTDQNPVVHVPFISTLPYHLQVTAMNDGGKESASSGDHSTTPAGAIGSLISGGVAEDNGLNASVSTSDMVQIGTDHEIDCDYDGQDILVDMTVIARFTNIGDGEWVQMQGKVNENAAGINTDHCRYEGVTVGTHGHGAGTLSVDLPSILDTPGGDAHNHPDTGATGSAADATPTSDQDSATITTRMVYETTAGAGAATAGKVLLQAVARCSANITIEDITFVYMIWRA
jgi:hypothetical protein